MRSIPLFAAAGLAAFAVPALGQSSVEIHTGANGQLSGSATTGPTSSTVTTGNGAQPRVWDERPPTGCTGGDRSRSMRVTSPDGSSSSSVSVSGGTVAVGGSGSPGSRISEEGCTDRIATTTPQVVERPAAVQPAPRVVTTPRSVARPANVRHRGYAHTTRRRVTRRR